MPRARLWIALCCIVALGACDLSSGGPPGRAVPPRGTPVTLAPPALSFATPAAPAQTVAVAESGYAGTFSVDASACAGIVTIVLSSDTRTLTVTPNAAGSCAAVVHDTGGAFANLTVSVSP